MPIRNYHNGYPDVSQGLQDVLRRNGMQAHISRTADGGYQLTVLGHDSPVLNYTLNEQQLRHLTSWGTNSANEKAYKTFTGIVKNDFDMPDNFTSAQNAFGRVSMGLHGYRLGRGEYYAPFSRGRGWHGDFIGWAPRTQSFHLRGIGDHAFYAGGPMVAERPDGRLKPGEMRSGGYGFYYKGRQQETAVDVLDNLQVTKAMQEPQAAKRPPKGQAIPYSEAINERSAVTGAFTFDKFKEVLDSHGLVIDKEKKVLTVMSANAKVDLGYDLKPDELAIFTSNRLTGKTGRDVVLDEPASLEKRLEVINNIIGKDFDTKVTKEMLESKEIVPLDLKPEVRAEVEKPFIEYDRQMRQQEMIAEQRMLDRQEADRIRRDPQAINGREIGAIMGDRGWFQPVEHGRQMYVGEIRVEKSTAPDNSGKDYYFMQAVINGRLVAHSISEKDFNKFIDLDDKRRLKMFDDVFKEVEIKNAHGKGFYQDDSMYITHDGKTLVRAEKMSIAEATSKSVDGAALQEFNKKKGFYAERAHGRELEVRDISVEQQEEGKYRMTAVINGESITHEITQKQYDKFLATDDYHRMQLFSKIFNEADIKTRPGEGVHIGAAILAAIVAGTEVAADIMVLGHGPGGPHPGPPREIYESKVTFSKPGVVSPADVAQANFQSQMASLREPDEGVRRGI